MAGNRGGKRKRAGRPFKWGEPQVQVRVPKGLLETVLKMITEYLKVKEKAK